MAKVKYVKPLLDRLPESMTAEDLDAVLRLDVAGCSAWDIALEIEEDVYTVFRVVVNTEYLRAKGMTTIAYWVGSGIPLVTLVWLIWPNLLLNTRTPARDGIDADAVKREYRGFFRLAAGGLLLVYVIIVVSVFR